MWSLECNKSFWQEPSQVRNEVNTHRGGKKQGRSRKRAWSHCLTLILKPPNVWVSICHSQRDLDFLLFAATCTLMEAGVAGYTEKRLETATGKGMGEGSWVLDAFLPRASLPKRFISETRFCFSQSCGGTK